MAGTVGDQRRGTQLCLQGLTMWLSSSGHKGEARTQITDQNVQPWTSLQSPSWVLTSNAERFNSPEPPNPTKPS